MTPEGRQKLKNLIIYHESYKQFPYTDTTGHITIGIGRNLSDRGISSTEAISLLENDILYFTGKLDHHLEYFLGLNEPRQIALINMCFNLGINNFLRFDKMLDALNDGNYELAAKEMLNSKWAKQVGERAIYLAKIMREGKL